ncbi:hypothetical protein predicted by Glimmer/Critica [Acetobacter ghanensis]|uniref:Uncharacterized protein n=1 Tax=Acetobacter ghanensis TaxID=431306 RepID=A0A0U5F1C5_9PROT|nr:hypothetical protein predicted by Glimmer/Critica [Acetobacter ghanensis]
MMTNRKQQNQGLPAPQYLPLYGWVAKLAYLYPVISR